MDERIVDLPADGLMLADDIPESVTVGELATAWLLDHEVRVTRLDEAGESPDETYLWAEDVFDHLAEVDPDLAWRATEALVAQATDSQLGYIVAAAVEDLLSAWPHLLPEVEALATRDERFREALGGVWQFFMSDETYTRVRAASAWPVAPGELELSRRSAGERGAESRDWQANARARRMGHLADGHPLVRHVSADRHGRTAIMLVKGASDRDARAVWCDLVGPATGYDASNTVVVDGRDRRRVWPSPRDCSDPKDVPEAARASD